MVIDQAGVSACVDAVFWRGRTEHRCRIRSIRQGGTSGGQARYAPPDPRASTGEPPAWLGEPGQAASAALAKFAAGARGIHDAGRLGPGRVLARLFPDAADRLQPAEQREGAGLYTGLQRHYSRAGRAGRHQAGGPRVAGPDRQDRIQPAGEAPEYRRELRCGRDGAEQREVPRLPGRWSGQPRLPEPAAIDQPAVAAWAVHDVRVTALSGTWRSEDHRACSTRRRSAARTSCITSFR